jgi:hypothetical protein
MAYLKALVLRFKEPSSWAGLAAFLGVIGVQLDSGLVESITFAGAGVAGIVAFFLPDA